MRQVYYQEPAPIAVVATEPFGYIGDCTVTSLSGNFKGWSFYRMNASAANLSRADLHHVCSRFCTYSGATLPPYIPSLDHDLVAEVMRAKLALFTGEAKLVWQEIIDALPSYIISYQNRVPLLFSNTAIREAGIRRMFGDRPNLLQRCLDSRDLDPTISSVRSKPPDPNRRTFSCSAWGIAGYGHSWTFDTLPPPDRPHDRWDMARKIERLIQRDTGQAVDCHVHTILPFEAAVTAAGRNTTDPDWAERHSWWGME